MESLIWAKGTPKVIAAVLNGTRTRSDNNRYARAFSQAQARRERQNDVGFFPYLLRWTCRIEVEYVLPLVKMKSVFRERMSERVKRDGGAGRSFYSAKKVSFPFNPSFVWLEKRITNRCRLSFSLNFQSGTGDPPDSLHPSLDRSLLPRRHRCESFRASFRSCARSEKGGRGEKQCISDRLVSSPHSNIPTAQTRVRKMRRSTEHTRLCPRCPCARRSARPTPQPQPKTGSF